MTREFDKISFFYDFIEKKILNDYKIALKYINQHLNFDKNQYIIDIGGGTGLVAKSIFDRVNNLFVFDYSKKMLKKIKNKKIVSIQGDAKKLCFADEVFDIALLVNTLHHIEKKYQITTLKEIFRILKKMVFSLLWI